MSAPQQAEEREAARSLKRHLSDRASVSLVDAVRVARELAKAGHVEARAPA